MINTKYAFMLMSIILKSTAQQQDYADVKLTLNSIEAEESRCYLTIKMSYCCSKTYTIPWR